MMPGVEAEGQKQFSRPVGELEKVRFLSALLHLCNAANRLNGPDEGRKMYFYKLYYNHEVE